MSLQPSKLWRQVAKKWLKEFPDVTPRHQLVDSAAMIMITNPARFDVVVTENLFGISYLTNPASFLELGVMPSASHSDQGPSMYEPIHGSAPDIAGQGIAYPISMILSVAMMLRDSLEKAAGAEMIEEAVNQTLNQGILTRDLGGRGLLQEWLQPLLGILRWLGETAV